MDFKALEEEMSGDWVLSKLSALACQARIPLFLVGGYIRDLLLGIRRKDYDLALAEEAASFIPKIEEALRFRFFRIGKEESGTVTYRISQESLSVDLTLFQGRTINPDLQRRDFTINAIAFSLMDRKFHWLEGALEDIEKRVIRSASARSIDEDPVRMLRAIRYSSTLNGFKIDPFLKQEVLGKKELIRHIPGERVKMELDQILLSPRPGDGLKLLHEVNLLFTLFPELKGLESLGPNEYHHLNILSHVFLMIEKCHWALEWCIQHGRSISLTLEDRLVLSYAALFHDLGKQDTYSQDEKGRIHFYHHETVSAKAAGVIMERLRFSNALKDQVLRIIWNHMRILNLSEETKETALKRLVHHIGDPTPLLVLHTLADKEASRGILSFSRDEVIENHCLRILELFQHPNIVHPPPLISGRDVMRLGHPPGPKVGEILQAIRNKQVVGEINTREEALQILAEKFSP